MQNREKYRGRQIKNTLTSLETLLPLKIQLRDDIKNFLSLKRRFKTLMHFVEERKIPVLEGQLTKLERELSEIRSELRAKTEEVQLLEVEKVQEMLGKKQLSQAIRHKIKKWSLRVEETKISRGFCFVELFEYVQDLHSSTVASMSTFDEFINGLDSSEFFAATVANQIKIWKLSLKAAEGIENCESAIALNMKTTYNFAKNEEYEKSKDIKEVNEEISKLFTEAKSFTTLNVEKFIEDFSKLQFEIAKELTEVDEHSWIRQKTLFELDQEISVQTISCELNPSLVKTLKAIEVFVRQRRELYADYQGPVFKHLKPLCQGNRCLWPQILSTVNIILFNTGSTARKAFRQLVGSNLKLDSFVLLGLDDLNLPKLAHPSQDLLEKLKSATSMVREDVPFKKTLKTLLRGIVLVNELDADENGLEIFPEIISFGPSGTTTNVRKLLRFQGEIAEKNWILLLQDLQKKIEKLAELEKEIVEDEKHSKDLSKEFSENSKKLTTEIENILIKSNSEQLQQLASRLHHKHDLQMCRLDYFVSLKALQAVDIAEISTWDEKDLMKMSPVPEKQELFIGDDIEHALIQLKFRHKLITDLLENPLNLQRNLDEFTQLYFNQLTKYQEEEQEQLQIQSNPVVIDSKLKVDLIELRCRLYEKKSQKSATVASLKLSTDHVKSRQDKLNFDFSVYDDYKNEPLEDIQEEIMNSHRALAKLISANPNLNRVTMNEYGKLQSMLKKTCAYSEMNISTSHFNVGAKTLPIIEKLQVTLLKDAVFSCRSSFGLTMCDFVESFSLVFFSRETFEMIDSSNYSWDNFNLARLKAMDFLVDWKENTEKVDVACFRRIKALLVIVHIIRTFSVFKFIIIDEKFFDVRV